MNIIAKISSSLEQTPYTRLIEGARIGSIRQIKKAILDGADISSKGFTALQLAVENGHEKCIKHLLPLSPSVISRTKALEYAAMRGHEKIVEILIPVSDVGKVIESLSLHTDDHQYAIGLCKSFQEKKQLSEKWNVFTSSRKKNHGI